MYRKLNARAALRPGWLLPLCLLWLALGAGGSIAHAQEDAFDLPAELYLLLNTGQVERYGVGLAGVMPVIGEEAGDEVLDFGVAPDNLLMAYRTNTSFNLLNMLTGEVRQIDGADANFPPYRGRGATIAWSPDGAVIAATTEYGIRFYFAGQDATADISIMPLTGLLWSPDSRFVAGATDEDVWWVYRRDGLGFVLHAIVPSSRGLAWADNAVLLFAPADGGLFLMDLDNANAQAQIAPTTTLYRDPITRPDLSIALFGRRPDDTRILESAAYLHRAEFVPGTGWQVTQVSEESVDLTGLRWSPSGNLLLTLTGGVVALIDPASAIGLTLPTTGIVAYGWGALDPLQGVAVASLPLSADAHFLAEDFTGTRQIWRAGRDGSPPAPLTQFEASAEVFAVAPDNATFAYVSDGALWLLPASEDEALTVAEVSQTRALSFSPAGDALVYDDGARVFRLGLDAQGNPTGAPQELFNGYSAPRYVGERLRVTLPDGDMALYDFRTGDLRRLGGFDEVLVLAGGQLMVAVGAPVAGNPYGLYLIDLTSDTPPAILYAPPAGRRIVALAEVSPALLRLVLAGDPFAPSPLEVGDLPLGGGQLAAVASVRYLGEPVALSPDGQYLAGFISATRTYAIRALGSGQFVVLGASPRATGWAWGQ